MDRSLIRSWLCPFCRLDLRHAEVADEVIFGCRGCGYEERHNTERLTALLSVADEVEDPWEDSPTREPIRRRRE